MDWTVRLGDVGMILTVIAGVVAMFFGVKSDVRIVKHDLRGLNDKVAAMAVAWEKLGNILTQVAVQDTRINRIEDDVREMRHGDGYVVARNGLPRNP